MREEQDRKGRQVRVMNECARGTEPGQFPVRGSRRSQCRSYTYLHRSVGTILLTYIEHNVCPRVTLERLLGEGEQLSPRIVIV